MEDKTWQDLSAEPYDSPLSYGGWLQARALGARIAGILCARELSLQHDENSQIRPENSSTDPHRRPASSGGAPYRRKKKQKIVIHSSPFLRCVQSSIGVSAGIAQFLGNQIKPQAAVQPRYPRNRLFSPARSHSADRRGMENRYTSPGRLGSGSEVSELGIENAFQLPLEKPLLRVDAWLGEWLSPSYYEKISPPPPSPAMLAAAKAELLKPAVTIQGVTSASGNTAVMYPDAEQDPLEVAVPSAFSTVGLTNSLPESIFGALPTFRDSFAGNQMGRTRSGSNSDVVHGGYTPPVPTYALSISEPIPSGFVAHARDACINLDTSWDSTKEPQSWGDGGEFGEEWSAMHVRFRSGLANVISWYREHGLPNQSQEETEDEDDGEDDIILVIVTHSAGCNALIGGITNQPVLLEMSTGSFTMALRKETPMQAPSTSPRHRRTSSGSSQRRSLLALAVHEEYDIRLLASADHLKAGAELLKMPQLHSPGAMRSIAEHSEGEAPRRNSALGSIRRRPASNSVSTQIVSPPLTSVETPISATGLWGGRKGSVGFERLEEEEQSAGQGMALGPAETALDIPGAREEGQITPLEGGSAMSQQSLGRSASQRGLWGGGPRSSSQRR